MQPRVLDLRQNKIVDAVDRPRLLMDGGQRRSDRLDVGPVLFVDRALGDPGAQRLFSASLSFLFESAGGIWSASWAAMRWLNSLLSGCPGTIARASLSRTLTAIWRTSSRSPRLAPGGVLPVQVKHLSDRMGRMSRL